MKILWINQHAAPIGGCERYIADTVELLNQRNVHSSLLYEVSGVTDVHWLQKFEHAFPIVKMIEQIKEIQPNVIYVHRLSDERILQELILCSPLVVRFFHDHQLSYLGHLLYCFHTLDNFEA